MIKINGIDILTPSQFKIGLKDIVKQERNANGGLIIEKIATKRILNLSYNYLSSVELSNLLNSISNITFNVTYPDSQTGNLRTSLFTCEGKDSEAIDYKNNTIRYINISFNFIEV